MYAVWKANTYTISYDANGGNGVPEPQTKTYGIDIILSNVVPTKEGYVFRGWSESSTAITATYPASGTFLNNKSTKLYAVWGLTYSTIPTFNYTGLYEIVDDDDNIIDDKENWSGDWKIRFLTSGELTFTDLRSASNGIDAFLVGGGGAGAYWQSESYFGAGGGGGYTTTARNVSVTTETSYTITIGAGGIGGKQAGTDGSESSAFGVKAAGGNAGNKYIGGNGGGGAGYGGTSGSGGSGIVIIRNAR